jgi:hypothetical protein
MVEIEIGVMVRQCLDRRIPDKSTLIAEIAKWNTANDRFRAELPPVSCGSAAAASRVRGLEARAAAPDLA